MATAGRGQETRLRKEGHSCEEGAGGLAEQAPDTLSVQSSGGPGAPAPSPASPPALQTPRSAPGAPVTMAVFIPGTAPGVWVGRCPSPAGAGPHSPQGLLEEQRWGCVSVPGSAHPDLPAWAGPASFALLPGSGDSPQLPGNSAEKEQSPQWALQLVFLFCCCPSFVTSGFDGPTSWDCQTGWGAGLCSWGPPTPSRSFVHY